MESDDKQSSHSASRRTVYRIEMCRERSPCYVSARASATRCQGLPMVWKADRRLKHQVSSLGHRHDKTSQAYERNPECANVISICDSPSIFVGGEQSRS
jgi:hypothetical protein